MKRKLINDGSEKTYVLIFDIGDEVVSELSAFARENSFTASRFTGIGACERVTFGFYDLEQKDYQKIEVNEQVEVMSLIGNLSLGPNGEPKVHGHIVVGKADGTAHGGHLLEAVVRPTLELFLIESPAELRRQMNSEVGLPPNRPPKLNPKTKQKKEERKMRKTKFQQAASIALFVGMMITASVVAQAQGLPTSQPTSQPKAEAKSQGPTLTATLVDATKKAQQKAATVEVKTTGIELIDPAQVNELPKAGQGHLHYQVDNGPIIATTTTKLSFHGLTPGAHKIVVMLAGNDHNPLGPQQTLEVTIP